MGQLGINPDGRAMLFRVGSAPAKVGRGVILTADRLCEECCGEQEPDCDGMLSSILRYGSYSFKNVPNVIWNQAPQPAPDVIAWSDSPTRDVAAPGSGGVPQEQGGPGGVHLLEVEIRGDAGGLVGIALPNVRPHIYLGLMFGTMEAQLFGRGTLAFGEPAAGSPQAPPYFNPDAFMPVTLPQSFAVNGDGYAEVQICYYRQDNEAGPPPPDTQGDCVQVSIGGASKWLFQFWPEFSFPNQAAPPSQQVNEAAHAYSATAGGYFPDPGFGMNFFNGPRVYQANPPDETDTNGNPILIGAQRSGMGVSSFARWKPIKTYQVGEWLPTGTCRARNMRLTKTAQVDPICPPCPQDQWQTAPQNITITTSGANTASLNGITIPVPAETFTLPWTPQNKFWSWREFPTATPPTYPWTAVVKRYDQPIISNRPFDIPGIWFKVAAGGGYEVVMDLRYRQDLDPDPIPTAYPQFRVLFTSDQSTGAQIIPNPFPITVSHSNSHGVYERWIPPNQGQLDWRTFYNDNIGNGMQFDIAAV